MTTTTIQTDAWRGHALRADYVKTEGDDEVTLVDARCGCGQRPGSDDDPQLWFAEHLKESGGEDYAVEFERTWRELVTDERGNLDEDKVARELSDYSVVMGEASKVYEELAGLSKPNTAAHHIIAGAEQKYREVHADLVLFDLLPQMESDADRQAVIDYANDLHPSAYEDYLRGQKFVAELAAKRAAKKDDDEA